MPPQIDLPHSAAPQADQYYEGGLPTDKNWVDFAVSGYPRSNQFFAYLDATQHLTNALEMMILQPDEPQTLEEFKVQLREFCNGRRAFLDSINSTPSPSDIWP
ncbi:hypothetical protein [Spirosoma endophyticum]|uniref:Uncharacterized protein n=1 Tax=Spirosoma endophyticum TaxID=662367 RepID=A0A1I2GDG7_9BACT|nr:hypothetical protein [Spirosoma endophyticum]SFF15040.1 hypothetical protein SAMN05216167_13124 [Spirosoma endophyticum]